MPSARFAQEHDRDATTTAPDNIFQTSIMAPRYLTPLSCTVRLDVVSRDAAVDTPAPRLALPRPKRGLYLPAAFHVQFLNPCPGLGLAIFHFDRLGATEDCPVGCHEMQLFPSKPGSPSAAVGDPHAVRYALAAAARPTPDEILDGARAEFAYTSHRQLQTHFDSLTRRPAGRPRIAPDLDEVAAIARANPRTPVKAIIDAYADRYVSRRTAQRMLRRVERRGMSTN